MKTIYLAGGCFWGVEHFLKQIKGVVSTEVGYANGNKAQPTYEEVCKLDTHFVEVVKVDYQPDVIELKLILDAFYKIIDPTSLNQQGNDRGEQYRTGIYYDDESDLEIIGPSIVELQKHYINKIVVEVEPLNSYYSAEGYHQGYLDKNPTGYCHIKPSMFDYAKSVNNHSKDECTKN